MENNQHLVDSILETVREELADFIESRIPNHFNG